LISGLEHSRIIKEPKLRPLEIRSRVFKNQAKIGFRTLGDWNGAKSQTPKDRIEIGPKLDSRRLRDLISNVFKESIHQVKNKSKTSKIKDKIGFELSRNWPEIDLVFILKQSTRVGATL